MPRRVQVLRAIAGEFDLALPATLLPRRGRAVAPFAGVLCSVESCICAELPAAHGRPEGSVTPSIVR